MDDLVILFHHHKNDAVTRQNYQSWIKSNPGVKVIPIACDDGLEFDPMPEAVVVPCEFRRGFNWSCLDQIFSAWYRNNCIDAERYLLVESDSFCNVLVAEYYADYWHHDVVGAKVITIQLDPNWWCFDSVGWSVPWDWRHHVAAIQPFNGIMLSRAAMEILADERIEGLFCEMRLPTILRAGGFALTSLPESYSAINSFNAVGLPTHPGIWHPIKEVL